METNRFLVATSLAPKDFENQKQALASWKRLGFNIVSINVPEEIAILQSYFADINFVAAKRDGRSSFGKPYIYFDDFLSYFKNSEFNFFGIINSDIYLKEEEGHWPAILGEAAGSVVFGSRMDVRSMNDLNGTMYDSGFDYFFFDRKAISCYPQEEFCIGVPWWDYWAVVIPIINKVPVKKVENSVAYHIRHDKKWNHQFLVDLGFKISKYVDMDFELTPSTMVNYLRWSVSLLMKMQKLCFSMVTCIMTKRF